MRVMSTTTIPTRIMPKSDDEEAGDFVRDLAIEESLLDSLLFASGTEGEGGSSTITGVGATGLDGSPAGAYAGLSSEKLGEAAGA